MRKLQFYPLWLGILILLNIEGWAQSDKLQSGPMVGYSTMREVMLWVQTTEKAEIHFEYWEKGTPQKRQKSEVYQTKKSEAFTARVPIALLEPGKKYNYELFINKKKVNRSYPLEFQTQVLWQWRTDPPKVRFAFGSCSYINDKPYDRPKKAYGTDYQIFDIIYKQKPDFMLWGGDNIYLREADFDSKSGILYRYTHTRSNPEIQPLLGNIHHYAIWDDHDFGPNDSDRSYPLKNETLNAFKLFWANPHYGIEQTDNKGITGKFAWGDIEFFLLDNRYFRSPNLRKTGKREMFTEAQTEWLLDALKNSYASFKFVVAGGQFLNPEAYFENFAIYAEERQKLISSIRDEKIAGVFFLSGDRHHTELTKLQENSKVYPLYDLTCSALTAGTHADEHHKNTLIVPETIVIDHNFAMMEITGKYGERVLKITIIDKDGNEKWTKSISQTNLDYTD